MKDKTTDVYWGILSIKRALLSLATVLSVLLPFPRYTECNVYGCCCLKTVVLNKALQNVCQVVM